MSDEQGREEPPPGPTVLFANVDCAECNATFMGMWTDDSIDIQQMVDAPVTDQVCPNCGTVEADAEYPGWSSWSNAG